MMEEKRAGDSLAQRAYQHVWHGILSGRLRPGAVLSEAGLARSLGVSRTPVGEAIRKLADEGLLEQIPRFGTVVRSIAPEELVELCELQEAVQSAAAARAATKRSAGTLSRIRQVCDLIDALVGGFKKANGGALTGAALRRFLAADLAFHTLVTGAGGNRRILREAREIGTLQMVFWLRVGRQDVRTAREIQAGHERILDALEHGDAEAARKEMSEHLRMGMLQAAQHAGGEREGGAEDALRGLPYGILRELKDVDLPVDPSSSDEEGDEGVF